ncbi:hypothetical protein JNUCC1_03081 [Lentibacillus sp. JNUCC-1]|uniref:hypothetical protein n=1 Tax=Lentibacillus sp. JNUCC-1 TaxID=2654513 RepID=UPI0012E9175C|nr:hypothetical protein [Lentibacillus sp. JNUCC-1]MUV39208.1 hypothetical protein [Lentibacillus sp. JNUCC-1]
MKKLYMLSLMVLMTGLLGACGASEEAEELADYHNSYVETVNDLASQVDEEMARSYNAGTPEEALQIQEEKVMPLVDEIMGYIDSLAPKTDVVKELHEKRKEQLDVWSQAMTMNVEALKKSVEGANEEEVNQLLGQSDEKLTKARENAQKADAFMAEMAEEHDVEIKELDEK